MKTLIPIIISILGVLIAAGSLRLSWYIFKQNNDQLKQDLSAEIICSFFGELNKERFVFVTFVLINKSASPISITEAIYNVHNGLNQRRSFSGLYNRVRLGRIYIKNSKGIETESRSYHTDSLPINIPGKHTVSATIAIKTPDYYAPIASGHNPRLTLKTTGTPITIGTQQLTKSVTTLEKRLLESYSL